VTTPTPKDKDYQGLLRDIKSRIRAAQIRASLSVNRELIKLYWDVGEMIVNRQRVEGWGKSIVDELAVDLQKDFPGIEGFSPRNIWRMRAFYVAWACDKPQRAVAKRGQKSSARPAPRERQFLPQAVAEIPWGHNVTLVEKLKDSVQRTWYAQQATVNGWSRSMLDHWIESDLYSRQGKAVTNFKQALPPPQSDLANEIVRDPYNFDFLTLRDQAAERELENGLLAHIRRFLIELGSGFAFVGQQVHLPVDGEDPRRESSASVKAPTGSGGEKRRMSQFDPSGHSAFTIAALAVPSKHAPRLAPMRYATGLLEIRRRRISVAVRLPLPAQ